MQFKLKLSQLFLSIFLSAIGLLIASLLVHQQVNAATLTVGTGQAYTDVATAVAAADPDDTIQILNGTFTANDINITKNLTINGNGAASTILQADTLPNQSNTGRLFNITGGVDVNISNITMRNGYISNDGGAIYCNCNLDVDSVSFIENGAVGSSDGGAIYITGAGNTLTVSDSTFTNNAVDNYGGAIYVDSSSVNIDSSSFLTNSASEIGGAIQISNNSGNDLSISNNLFSGNYSANNSAGAFRTNSSGGTVTFTNNTLTNNSANSQFAGGAELIGAADGALFNLANNTFYENNANSGGREIHLRASCTSNCDVTFNLTNNLVYNSTETNYSESEYCMTCTANLILNRNGTHVGDTSMPDTGGTGNLDLVLAGIDALADNGGPTHTMAVQSSSGLRNAGVVSGAPTSDARGVSRGTIPDIGAYEFVPADQSTTYRFYNSTTGAHFYTSSTSQRDSVINNYPEFSYEGEQYTVFASTDLDLTAVYRFYNVETGAHFYTSSSSQRDSVINNYPQFSYEGIAFYVFNSAGNGGDRIPVYRFYNTVSGAHFYTSSASQRDSVINNYPDFIFEGIAYYVPA